MRFNKPHRERKPRRLYRHEVFVMVIGYTTILYALICAVVYVLTLLAAVINA